jgi:glycosyltransferase involved in cell wall biosynthesis
MKVLFVIRDHKAHFAKSPFIARQASSLAKQGVDVDLFMIQKGGVFGYLLTSIKLKKYIEYQSVDLVHAHYSLCGLTAVLARSGKPVVLSLMGSDILGEYFSASSKTFKSKLVIHLTRLILPYVDFIIAKSDNIYTKIRQKEKAIIIPNGIDLSEFIPQSREDSCKCLGLDPERKYVLFLNNPLDSWKNFNLAFKVVKMIPDEKVSLLTPYPVSQDLVVRYLNACNVLLMTSFMEGSSNLIKEAMACNCPIVTTDVGDAALVTSDVEGCYVSSFEQEDVFYKLVQALLFSEKYGRTKGRERIIKLGLDDNTIACKIKRVYEGLLQIKDSMK